MPMLIMALALGLIQGLCEFLPVSSSGHLVLAQRLFGLTAPEVAFDVALHLGTLTAVFIFYRQPLWRLILELRFLPGALVSPARMRRLHQNRPDFRFGLLVAAGCVPTGLMGYFMRGLFVTLFDSILSVGLALLVTGFFLMIAGRRPEGRRAVDRMTIWHALIIGFCQGLAITPGLSRSGATIGAGLLLGLRRELAARYSFIMSIPAILGATLLQLTEGPVSGEFTAGAFAVGLLTAAVCGYLALRLLALLIRENHFSLFAWWCWPMGLLAVTLHFAA